MPGLDYCSPGCTAERSQKECVLTKCVRQYSLPTPLYNGNMFNLQNNFLVKWFIREKLPLFVKAAPTIQVLFIPQVRETLILMGKKNKAVRPCLSNMWNISFPV